MNKILDDKEKAEKYWEKQLIFNKKEYLDNFNIGIYLLTDKNGNRHLYPDTKCKFCNEIKQAVIQYCSTKNYEQQLKIIDNLKDYKINGKPITGKTLLLLNDVHIQIKNLKSRKTECYNCKEINELCNKYYDKDTPESEKDGLLNRIEKYEMNGYKLLHFKEENGYYLNNIEIINHYLFNCSDIEHHNHIKKIDSKIDDNISLEHSRWCAICGARKPDINYI